jgi:hypothetical protein
MMNDVMAALRRAETPAADTRTRSDVLNASGPFSRRDLSMQREELQMPQIRKTPSLRAMRTYFWARVLMLCAGLLFGLAGA